MQEPWRGGGQCSAPQQDPVQEPEEGVHALHPSRGNMEKRRSSWPDPSLLESNTHGQAAGGGKKKLGQKFSSKAHIHPRPQECSEIPTLYRQRGKTKIPHLEWKVTPSRDMPRVFPQTPSSRRACEDVGFTPIFSEQVSHSVFSLAIPRTNQSHSPGTSTELGQRYVLTYNCF